MTVRVFTDLNDGVYRITIKTENWSEGDTKLMEQYGEPEIDVGGTYTYTYNSSTKTITFGTELVRILHGFPYARGFDSRDYEGGISEAMAVGDAWKTSVATSTETGTAASKINAAITNLRAKTTNINSLPKEEVVTL